MNNLVFTQSELKLLKNVVSDQYEDLVELGEECFELDDYIASSTYLQEADSLLTILCKLTTYLKHNK